MSRASVVIKSARLIFGDGVLLLGLLVMMFLRGILGIEGSLLVVDGLLRVRGRCPVSSSIFYHDSTLIPVLAHSPL